MVDNTGKTLAAQVAKAVYAVTAKSNESPAELTDG